MPNPKKPAGYRIDVAPLIMLPLGRHALFSYRSPKPVPPGSLVAIPFGKRNIQGIVYASEKAKRGSMLENLKPITEVIESGLLTSEQLQLADFVSQEYVTPRGRVLRHFAPPKAKARRKDISADGSDTAPLPSSAETERIIKRVVSTRKKAPEFFLDTRGLKDPCALYAALALQVASKGKQLLILVPETPLLDRYAEALARYLRRDSIAVIESKLPPGAYWTEWERIRQGSSSVVLSTRHGLFAPFTRLGGIIMAYEADMSYKQWDMSPRYHAKAAARRLASLHRAPLLWSTPAPSLETLRGLADTSITPLCKTISRPPSGLELVNMREERYRKNFSPLSAISKDRMKEALAQNRQVLVCVHQSGTSSLSVCTQCRSVLRCKECQAPLAETREHGYVCRRCGLRAGSFPNCASCRSIGFRPLVYGTERIETFLRREFPKARVVRADGRSLQKRAFRQSVFDDGSAGRIDILLGTQVIAKEPPLPRLGAVVIIDADSLLSGADFQNDERALAFLGSLPGLYAKVTGTVCLQTFQPEHPLFSTLTSDGYLPAAQALLADREALGYPPYSRLVAIEPLGGAGADLEARLKEFVGRERGTKLTTAPSSPSRPHPRFVLHLPPGPLSLSAQAFFNALGPQARIDPDPIRSI